MNSMKQPVEPAIHEGVSNLMKCQTIPPPNKLTSSCNNQIKRLGVDKVHFMPFSHPITLLL